MYIVIRILILLKLPYKYMKHEYIYSQTLYFFTAEKIPFLITDFISDETSMISILVNGLSLYDYLSLMIDN